MKRPSLPAATSMVLFSILVFSCAGEEPTGPSPAPQGTIGAQPSAPEGQAARAPTAKPTPPTTSTDKGLPDPLLAWADADPEDGKAPLRVQFNADVEGGTRPFKITWDFGDGSPTSSEANPIHVYEKAGEYEADLSVDDSAGDSDSDWVDIDVE